MYRFFLSLIAIAVSLSLSQAATEGANRALRTTPLGGIGTGYMEIREDGRFGEITVNNNRHRPIVSPAGCFAAVSIEGKGAKGLYWAEDDNRSVKEVQFNGVYPQADLVFKDSSLGADLTLEAFTPLILGDLEQSSTPAAVFVYRVKNTSGREIKATVAFSWANLIGLGGTPDKTFSPAGQCVFTPFKRGGLQGFQYTFEAGPTEGIAANAMGEHILAVVSEKNDQVSYLSGWQADASNQAFWGVFGRGVLPETNPSAMKKPAGESRPAAAVALSRNVPAGGESAFVFILSWYMPNQTGSQGKNFGVYYRNQWKLAQHVAEAMAERWPSLLDQIKSIQGGYQNPGLPTWFNQRLMNGAALLAKSGVWLENGQFALFTADEAFPGNIGSPEERLAHLPFFIRWYPSLLKSELQMFVKAQIPSGEIPSAAGNLYVDVGTGDVPGGFLGRPDSTLAFLIAAYHYALSTGDQAFLTEIAPHLNSAYAWLLSTDTNLDTIPNGPSLWPGLQPHQTSIFTADLFTAALRVGEEVLQDIELQSQLRFAREEAVRNLTSQLWNGRYYNLLFDPMYPASRLGRQMFGGTLPGEWFALSKGMNLFLDTYRLDHAYQSLAQAVNTGSLYDSTTLGDHAFYRKIYPAWVQAFSAPALARTGQYDICLQLLQQNPEAYRNDTDASLWAVYNAIGGMAVDMKNQCLIVGPVLPDSIGSLSIPFKTPVYSGWIQYQRAAGTAMEQCVIHIGESASGTAYQLKQAAFLPPTLMDANAVVLRVLRNDEYISGQDFTRENLRVFGFEKPLSLRKGDTLTLIMAPQNGGKIRFDLAQYKVNNQGAQCAIQMLSRSAPNYSLVVTNLLPQQQIVNLEFHRGQSQDSYTVYLNGEKLPAMSAEAQAYPILLQTSPIALSDYEWLQLTAKGCEAAIVRAAGNAARKELHSQLWKLQEAVNEVIALDAALRGMRVDVIYSTTGESPQKVDSRISVKQMQEALENAKNLATRFRQGLSRSAGDPVLAAQIMGDFIPLQVQVAPRKSGPEGKSIAVDVFVQNPYSIPHDSRMSLEAPRGWTVIAKGSVALNEMKQQSPEQRIAFEVEPEGDLKGGRFALKAVMTGTWESFPFRHEVEAVVGHAPIVEWLVIGPFSNLKGEGFNYQYMPQQNIKPKENYEGMGGEKVGWQKKRYEDGYVNFDATFTPNDNAVGYAYVGVYSPREQNVLLHFGCGGDIKIFHNYREIYSQRNLRKPEPGSETTKLLFTAGWNHLLVKVSERTEPWGFYFEITDQKGLYIPELEFSLDKAE